MSNQLVGRMKTILTCSSEDSYEWQLLAQLPCPKSSFYSICVTSNGIMLTGLGKTLSLRKQTRHKNF